MTTRFWWIFISVATGALLAAGVLARLYVAQHVPPQAVLNRIVTETRAKDPHLLGLMEGPSPYHSAEPTWLQKLVTPAPRSGSLSWNGTTLKEVF